MGAYMVTHGRPHVARVLCHLQEIWLDNTSEIYGHIVLVNKTIKVVRKASKSMQSYDRTMEVLKELDINGMSREQLLNNEKSKQAEHKQLKDYSKRCSVC
uniref:Uncharacterized protein n=1 Tax=Oryza glumipatula TaxID=40148 RepID=A0A0D9YPW2_9ORYZ